MDEKTKRLVNSIVEWYQSNPHYLEKVLYIVRREHTISLRIIDHFVTNYTQRKRVFLDNPLKEGEKLDVFASYKDALRCFHKNLFDPFRRSTTQTKMHPPYTPIKESTKRENGKSDFIKSLFGKKDGKVPSLRQLIFFRWAISTGVLDYVIKNYKAIEEDMVQFKHARTLKEVMDSEMTRIPMFVLLL